MAPDSTIDDWRAHCVAGSMAEHKPGSLQHPF